MDLPAPWPKAISLRDTLSAAQGFFAVANGRACERRNSL